MTSEEIINGAACIDSCIPEGEQLSVLVYLASLILEAGTLS